MDKVNRTKERYETAWKNLTRFLNENKIPFPQQFKRKHLFEYLKWRTEPNNEGRPRVSHNTALYELKFMSQLLDEAIRRGYCLDNPCRRLGIKKQPIKPKPEITGQDIALILRELAQEPEWMGVSFRIAILHGTRLQATSVHLRDDIDLTTRRITFHEKGGKVFTVPLHEDLVTMVQQLRSAGAVRTCIIPKGASKRWRQFFDRIGRPQYCFHCCRVTVITRQARSGVSEGKAMRYVGHASTEIHRVYQRLKVEDLSACHAPLALLAVNMHSGLGGTT